MALGRSGAARALALLVVCVSLYYAVWGGEYSALDIRRLHVQHRLSLDSLRAAEREVDSLRLVARRLENDPATLERVARERFGMIRDGELLYRFVPVAPASPPAPAGP